MKRLLILLVALTSGMGGTSLTGTFKAPDGTGANGYLYLSMAQQASVVSTGSCGGPLQVVPTYEVRIQVVSGTMQGSPSVYGNDCMQPSGTFYNVKFIDLQGNQLMRDRWIISGATVDVGTIVSAVVTGTTTSIGANNILIGTPNANQTVTQPSGTSLIVNSLTISSQISFPSNFQCDLNGCQFGLGVDFTGGIRLGSTTNSEIYVGTGGNFYNRTYTGGAPVCSGVQDGWTAIEKSSQTLYVCINGTAYGVQLQ
jgi:hypothetical protein